MKATKYVKLKKCEIRHTIQSFHGLIECDGAAIFIAKVNLLSRLPRLALSSLRFGNQGGI